MKILEEGFGEDWKLTIRCEIKKDENGLTWDSTKSHCGSLLEVDKDDIMTRRWDKFLYNARGTDYVVKCPKCGCCLYIKPSLIPEFVKEIAKNNPYKK